MRYRSFLGVSIMLRYEGDDVPVELLPVPTLWRILIGELLEEEQIGAIYIPPNSTKASQHFANVGKVLAIGDRAFDDPSFRGGRSEGAVVPAYKVGDIVYFPTHGGAKIANVVDGKTVNYRIFDDRNVLGICPDPTVLRGV